MLKHTEMPLVRTLPEAFLDTLPHLFCRFYCVKRSIRFDYVSRIISDWTGCTPQTFVAEGRNWLDYVHPSDRRLLLDALRTATEREDDYFTVDYRLADGDRIRHVHHTARHAMDDDGDAVMWNGCIEDVTPMRQAQRELERSQLLQSMGRLVAGIAHEINTPVQFIGDNLHFLAEAWEAMCVQLRTLKHLLRQNGDKTEQDDVGRRDMEFLLAEAPDAIRQSLEGIDCVSDLVTAMRDFSRLDERRMAAASLNRAIRSSLTLLRNELKYTADIQTELDPSLPEVHCSIDEIIRVLLNLLINAGHSIKEKIDKGLITRGCIRIKTRRLDKQVEIAVMDNGMGIPESIRHRIFDRFYTTKRNLPTQGTGQGLTMARSIVEEHHCGRITFESEVERGTMFYIRLPLDRPTERTR